MENYRLKSFKNGWFIGDFEPSLFKTNDVEVAVQHYKAGDTEAAHFHKIATEYTVIVKGQVKMAGRIYTEDMIVKIPPHESTDFTALTDATTVVVKLPGVNHDKYLTDEQ